MGAGATGIGTLIPGDDDASEWPPEPGPELPEHSPELSPRAMWVASVAPWDLEEPHGREPRPHLCTSLHLRVDTGAWGSRGRDWRGGSPAGATIGGRGPAPRLLGYSRTNGAARWWGSEARWVLPVSVGSADFGRELSCRTPN
jgi:hypothetical protein